MQIVCTQVAAHLFVRASRSRSHQGFLESNFTGARQWLVRIVLEYCCDSQWKCQAVTVKVTEHNIEDQKGVRLISATSHCCVAAAHGLLVHTAPRIKWASLPSRTPSLPPSHSQLQAMNKTHKHTNNHRSTNPLITPRVLALDSNAAPPAPGLQANKPSLRSSRIDSLQKDLPLTLSKTALSLNRSQPCISGWINCNDVAVATLFLP